MFKEVEKIIKRKPRFDDAHADKRRKDKERRDRRKQAERDKYCL